MGCWCCFPGLLNYSMFQTPHLWVSRDPGPRQELVLLCQSRWTFDLERPSQPLPFSPFFGRNRGDDSVIKKTLFMQMKGDSFCRLLGFFFYKCLRVHSCSFRWETGKGCKSFRHYIWNGVQWKPFRRDVWVKALRNVNLISLKPCNTEILCE